MLAVQTECELLYYSKAFPPYTLHLCPKKRCGGVGAGFEHLVPSFGKYLL